MINYKSYLVIPVLVFASSTMLFSQNIYQAEEAEVISRGVVEDEHVGFTGQGYVNPHNEIGSFVEWVVSFAEAGDQSVTIFYANGTTQDREMDIHVNGNLVLEGVPFPGTGGWTTWGSITLDVPFDAGGNTFRLTSVTASGGPNLDRFEVTGQAGGNYYMLNIDVFGEGEVEVNPQSATNVFHEGQSITLTAIPNSGYSLAGWRGDSLSQNETIEIAINSHTYIIAVFLRQGVEAETNQPIGWVNYNYNVTGGDGGTEVVATNQSELEAYIGSSSSYTIKVKGTIEITPFGKKIDVGSNTTIEGYNLNSTIKGGGIRIRNAENVIVRGLHFRDAFVDWEGKTTDNDAIEINNSKHIWINHCDFSHYDDGLIDVKNGSDLITVSWCRFHNHNKVMLIGVDDGHTQDQGRNRITVHHCWFDGRLGNGIGQRLPRVRYGKAHVFNNFYQDVLVSGVMAGYDGDIYLENCYFKNVNDPHSVVGGAGGGNNKMNVSGNILVDSPGRNDVSGESFRPSDYYSYSAHDAEDVPALAMVGAGVVPFTHIGSSEIDSPIDDIPIDTTDTNSSTHSQIFWYGGNSDSFIAQNYPNPFSSNTTIAFSLPEASHVKLQVFDASGKNVALLLNQVMQSGEHSYIFEASHLKPGVYFYRYTAGSFSEVRRMVLIRVCL